MSQSQQFYKQVTAAIAGYLFQELKIRPEVDYKIRSAVSGPRVLTLSLLINPSLAKKVMGMSEPLSMAARLGKNETIRISRGYRGSLALEIPKPRDLWQPLPLSALPRRRGLKTTLGLDSEHRPAIIDFAEPDNAHCLIAGATGSGKTNAQQLFIYNLATQNEPSEARFILIDTEKRGIGWSSFARLPHLGHPIITCRQEAGRLLAWAMAEIDRRAGRKQRGEPLGPRYFIGIDEVQSLLEMDEFIKPMANLAAIGREFGLHLLAATQNPTAEKLGDVSIKRNMVRLVGRVDSAEAARVATGQAGSGAEMLTGKGDMLLVTPGDLRRLCAALLTDKDTAKLPRVESIRSLDLSEYEDIEHVTGLAKAQISAGRTPDPLEPEHVAAAMIEPDISQRELYRRFSIGRPKAKAVIAFATATVAALEAAGYRVCSKRERNGVEKNGMALPFHTTSTQKGVY